MKLPLFLSSLFVCLGLQAQNLQWALPLDTGYSKPTAIALDDSGNVFTAMGDQSGTFTYSYYTGNVTLLKQDKLGNILWKLRFSGAGRIMDMEYNQGNLYVTGFQNAAFQLDTNALPFPPSKQMFSFLASISSGGQVNWAKQPALTDNNLLATCKIHNNELYVGGVVTFNSGLLMRYSLNGVHQQTKTMAGLRGISDLDFDSGGNLYLVATGGPTAIIDGVPMPPSSPPSLYLHILLKLSPQWQVDWARTAEYLTFDFNCQLQTIGDSIYFLNLGRLAPGISTVQARIIRYDTSGSLLNSINGRISTLSSRFISTKTKEAGKPRLAMMSQQFTSGHTYIDFYNSDLSLYRKDSLSGVSLSNLAFNSSKDVYVIGVSGNTTPVSFNGQFQFQLSNSLYTYSAGNLYFSTSSLQANFNANLTTVCHYDTVTFSDLSSNSPTSWSWVFTPPKVTFVNGTSASSQNPQVVFDSTANYQVSLKVSNAQASDSLIKNTYITAENIPVPSIFINGLLLTCNEAGYNYQWYINGNAIAGATSQTYPVVANGSYSVEISLINCSEKSSSSLISNVGIEDLKATYGFRIYPNPATHKVQFEMENPGEPFLSYTLSAIDGTIVFQQRIATSKTVTESIDLTSFASGLYFLKIKVGEAEWAGKVVKE